jgi:hypothetical protein
MDVHKQETQVCIEDGDGAVVLEQRIRTTRERLTALLSARPRARILLEAATESEWVAQHLEGLGHEVIVADPNYAAMYATRSRRVKTDRRDARTLADACRWGRTTPRTGSARSEVRGLGGGRWSDAHAVPHDRAVLRRGIGSRRRAAFDAAWRGGWRRPSGGGAPLALLGL